jgi:hypothetical protein
MHTLKYKIVVKPVIIPNIAPNIHELFQAENVRDAAWGCDWVGTPVSFQRSLVFIITTANKGFTLTAGKFVPVSNSTMMNVRILIIPSATTQYHLSQTVPLLPHKAQLTL